MSIRLRLTLLYCAILALTLTAFGTILYVIQARYTLNLFQQDLALTTRRIVTGIAWLRAGQDRPQRWTEPGGAGRPQPIFGRDELRELRVRDETRVLSVDAAAIDHPINEDGQALPLSDAGLVAVQNGESWVEIASVEGERLLVLSTPVVSEGQVTEIVQVARPLTDRDRALRALGGTLIVGGLLTTLFAFGVGWMLSGITLRPIHRITQTAQAIGAGRDLERRVRYSGPNDEVGQLATTFNAMLARLQDAYRRVEHSLEMQQRFVADVSHELRTPLTTIRGNLALLYRRPPIPRRERDDILADVVSESERLIRLVSDLLKLARADAGRQVHRERVELRPLVEDVCDQARVLGPQRTVDCADLADATVLADRDALKEVLLILLDNALKHAADPITVSVVPQQGEVAIHIGDAGPGMDVETCAHIFDRFYRGVEAHRRSGFGLGLSIAKALVEGQGGSISVESQIGRGSAFSVMLPQVEDPIPTPESAG